MTGVAIRAEGPADRAAIRSLLEQAFGQDEEARLVEALRGTPAFIPELSLVAVEGADVVGYLLFTRMRIPDGERPAEALSLAPLGVLPARQSQGIGTALVEYGLAECRRLDHRIVVVLGHAEYYPRFGFVAAEPLGIHPPFEARPGSFRVLELAPGALSGVGGTVVYPPEFDDAVRSLATDAPRPEVEFAHLQAVGTFSTPIEANLVHMALTQAGIRSTLSGEHLAGVHAPLGMVLGVGVWVAPEDLPAARELLEAARLESTAAGEET